MEKIEINGRLATVDDLRHTALRGYGHFTAMQVRDRRVRGLDLHLSRLRNATRELFDRDLDTELVRARVRHALEGEDGDASVRVYVYGHDLPVWDEVEPQIMVSVRPPTEPPSTPRGLWPAPFQREAAHLKHIGGFGQAYFSRLAERAGFDEALLVAADGTIAEGAITNIGFWDGTCVVWPEAPMLRGITMMLVERGLADMGVPVRHQVVRLSDLPSFRSVFLTNSWGVMQVDRVDDLRFALDERMMAMIRKAHERNPWDLI
ncbi:aminotransferase class IV family protein [Sphaerisporangium fuscum]|uniref:aminotransferase class IV family protein n=1 Tax=Sphaerisporangium fuscum TaxID=2835868 RepID=UPI001BDD48E7|nr:aminotransferase class IV family protein [Sphaerisporangium fuscum]